mgnify:FL=1
MLVATFDIGTTAVKAVAVRDDGEPFFTGSQVIHTIEKNGFKEQNPEEWYSAFCALSHALTDKISAKDISALIFSGQMQDVIPVGSDRRALGNAILYSDGRAGAQAEAIENAVGSDTITAITGNHFDGSMPLAKILWLKENQPEIYEKAAAFLISSKDYVVARLTGNFIGDMTACATAGAMDLEHKTWSEHLINGNPYHWFESVILHA